MGLLSKYHQYKFSSIGLFFIIVDLTFMGLLRVSPPYIFIYGPFVNVSPLYMGLLSAYHHHRFVIYGSFLEFHHHRFIFVVFFSIHPYIHSLKLFFCVYFLIWHHHPYSNFSYCIVDRPLSLVYHVLDQNSVFFFFGYSSLYSNHYSFFHARII